MKRRILQGFILIVFLSGLCLFLYPYVVRWTSEKKTKQVISEFKNLIKDEKEKKTDAGTVNLGVEDNKAPLYEELYHDFQVYNQQIYEEGQKELKDPFSYETTAFDLTGYGFTGDVIGILWIPRLDSEFPVYLGANNNTMAKGIGLLGQTSMPIGGENTNIVLAGHRGYRGIPMFRDIQSIQTGDKIQITTPWETLIYRVCELKIVPKDNTDVIYIQKGRDLVTLLTCHPYTQNTHRYVVIAERSYEPVTDNETDREEAQKTKNAAPQEVEVLTEYGSMMEMVNTGAISAVMHEGMAESGTAYSDRQIWLETYIPVIGIGIVIFVAVFLGFLTVRTKKSKKKKNTGTNL